MKVRFSVGIDLGTSNSAIAVGDIESGDTKIVEIGQIVGPNQLSELPTLPSAIYVPHREEFPEGSFPLPWNDAGEPAIVGQFARDRGALVPDRLVTSAKSWLSNPHIDLGRVKTKSDLVVMPSGRQIFAFFCSPHDRRAQKSRCGYTA
jgi:molecular chaperone DnaK (HSP70)